LSVLADFIAEVGFEGRVGRPVEFFETATVWQSRAARLL
jgi:hypothetical protein